MYEHVGSEDFTVYRLKKRSSAGDIEKGADDKSILTSAGRGVHEGLPYSRVLASYQFPNRAVGPQNQWPLMAGTPEHLHTRCKLVRLLGDLYEQMISNNVVIARDLLVCKIKSRILISNRRNFKRSFD